MICTKYELEDRSYHTIEFEDIRPIGAPTRTSLTFSSDNCPACKLTATRRERDDARAQLARQAPVIEAARKMEKAIDEEREFRCPCDVCQAICRLDGEGK